MAEQSYHIEPVTSANAAAVAVVFRSIYGDDFPVPYVYDVGQLLREIDSGRLAASLAFDRDDAPAGYVAAFKCAPNPRLWEGGNLVVVPAHGQGNLAWLLLRHYLQPGRLPGPVGDGIFCESVCHHYFTQLGCSKAGFFDCALGLDQLDAASFREHRPQSSRVACLLQFVEQRDPDQPFHLPARYAETLRALLAPLRPRSFLPATAPLPDSGATVQQDNYYASAATWRISVSAIGADWPAQLAKVLDRARQRQVISLQLIMSAALPCLDAAIEEMRQQGFFFGGVFPRWFGADGILLQQVLGREPDLDEIKLYTTTAKDLLCRLRDDRDRPAAPGQA
ncbi:MAG: hypothetical protein BWK76_20550 [Desulfobulbaceae bacterium A2]|nr:MAG: hypothetical protein BWK76_20550 [Desulfobulbaceae bacterium A2]